MSSRVAAWLAWSLCAFSPALTVLGLLLLVLCWVRPAVNVFDYWVETTAIAVAVSAVGALIASRRPEHQVGWLFYAIGSLAGIDHFCGEYATYALLAQLGLYRLAKRRLGSAPGSGSCRVGSGCS